MAGFPPLAAATPAGYPGPMAGEPCLVDAVGVRPWSSTAAGLTAARFAVLAIGSNANPDVLRAKLRGRGASCVVPLVPVVVTGLSVAHSAHVSLAGVVAAAPRHDPGGAVRGVITWLTGAQLAVLDATEPNYQRIVLDRRRYPWASVVPTRLDALYLYRSRWGLLAPDGERPAPLGTQARLHAMLADDPVVTSRLPVHDSQAMTAALTHQHVQVWLRRHWAKTGRAVPDGLSTGPRLQRDSRPQLQPLVDPQPSQT